MARTADELAAPASSVPGGTESSLPGGADVTSPRCFGVVDKESLCKLNRCRERFLAHHRQRQRQESLTSRDQTDGILDGLRLE